MDKDRRPLPRRETATRPVRPVGAADSPIDHRRSLPSCPYDNRPDWRDTSRQILPEDRPSRGDGFADSRHIERQEAGPSYNALPRRQLHSEQQIEALLPGPSRLGSSDLTGRASYRYQHYDQPYYESTRNVDGPSDYYGFKPDRRPYTAGYVPIEALHEIARRDRSPPFQRAVYDPVTDSRQPSSLSRDPDSRADHRDKRARIDPWLRPTLAAESASKQASLSLRSSASASVDYLDRPDLRDGATRLSNTEIQQREAMNRDQQSEDWVDREYASHRRRSSSSSSYSQEGGATGSIAGQSVGKSTASGQLTAVKRRKRAVLSCTECKQRKIKCDRNVPNCGSCVRRGVAHLCRWGDERDFGVASQSGNITPSNAALMARIAQLESLVRVLQSTGPSVSSGQQESTSADRRHAEDRPVQTEPSLDRSATLSVRSEVLSDEADPPDFTSRDRGAKARRYHRSAGNITEARSEISEQDSDGEDAQGVLGALAMGMSLKTESVASGRLGPAPGVGDAKTNLPESSAPRPKLRNVGATGSQKRPGSDTSRVVPDEPQILPDALDSRFVAFDAVSGLFDEMQDEKMHAQMIAILELLPVRDKTDAIVQIYLRETEPIINSVHVPSFTTQLERFWLDYELARQEVRRDGKLSFPDLQFAALLIAIVGGACEYMTPAEILDSQVCSARSTINSQLARLPKACLSLLSMDKFAGHPRMCGLQAIIALRHYCFNRDHGPEYTVLLHMAMKAAENIGLHRLGSALKDEERWAERDELLKFPGKGIDGPHDPSIASESFTGRNTVVERWRTLVSVSIQNMMGASPKTQLYPEGQNLNSMWLPPGSQRAQWELHATKRFADHSRVQRETGRKVWFAMVNLDWLCAAHFDRCYHGNDNMFTTQSPQNIDDEDVVDAKESERGQPMVDDAALRFVDKIREPDVPTVNSFIPINIEICHTVRSVSDAMNRGDDSRETVASIEARFRNILSSLPAFFRLDGESEYDPRIHRLHMERPYLSFQRAMIHEFVHHRMLQLHRLLMSRGYRNAKHIHSTRTCIEGGRIVIAILSALDRVGCRGQRYWIFKFHLFHAVLAVQVDLLYLARQPVDREIEAKQADVIAGLKMLHARTDVEGKNPLLASLLKVIKGLREEEQSRRFPGVGSADGSGHSDRNTHGSSSDMRESQSPQTNKDKKERIWTRASESTGELAEHLGRRIEETWYSVDQSMLRRGTTAVDPALTSLPSDDSSVKLFGPVPTVGLLNLRKSETHDKDSILDSDAAVVPQGADNETLDAAQGDKSKKADLDIYLDLLSSYQNSGDNSEGSEHFDILNDSVFENASTSNLTFGEMAAVEEGSGARASASQRAEASLFQSESDIALAGAGFDSFS